MVNLTKAQTRKLISSLKKASKTHASQARILEKSLKSKTKK
jgi:hypothetical protein|tara:strand:+ start:3582 stop:3704 length:123 start_codon:yes stop_codon:yes gene_type:complete